MPRPTDVPSYESLLARTDAPPGSSWGLFGADDEIGTLNFLPSNGSGQPVSCAAAGRSHWIFPWTPFPSH